MKTWFAWKNCFLSQHVRKTFLTLGAILICESPAVSLGQAPFDCDDDYYPGRVLVRFKEGSTAAAKDEAHTAAGRLETLSTFEGTPGLRLVRAG